MTDRPILFSAPMILALLDGRKTQTRRILTRNNVEVLGSSWRGKSCPWEGLRFGEAVVRENSPISGQRDPHLAVPFCHPAAEPTPSADCGVYRVHPIIQPADRLFVRETLRNSDDGWFYDADRAPVVLPADHPRFSGMIAWAHHKEGDTCVSIHMPRWASRLTLTVTDVRIERLQAISETDAVAEGMWSYQARDCDGDPRLDGRAYNATFWHWRRDIEEGDGYSSAVSAYRHLWGEINGAGSWETNPWVIASAFSVERRNIDA